MLKSNLFVGKQDLAEKLAKLAKLEQEERRREEQQERKREMDRIGSKR